MYTVAPNIEISFYIDALGILILLVVIGILIGSKKS
jgi:hypothetical protein